MAKDTELHYRELIITLDYLLNHTDEYHPATTVDICIFAKDKYGLRYNTDSSSMEGNEIDRRRIGNCLRFLASFSEENELPFVMQMAGKKFYIEQKNYLNEEQIAKILAAVVNDKYTHDEDTSFLVDRLLEVLSTSEYNREQLTKRYEHLLRHTKKYSEATTKKIRLIKKAYDEKKSICIVLSHFGRWNPDDLPDLFHQDKNKRLFIGTIDKKVRCRVYRIEEHNNKPYAILLPLVHKGVIFDAIENLNIPLDMPIRELLLEDEDREDRLEELFKMNNHTMAKFYGTLDEYIDKQVMPEKGHAYKTSFYFDYKYLERVKDSFEEVFAIDMPVTPCNHMSIDEQIAQHSFAMELPYKADKYAIKCEPLPENYSSPRYGVVNVTINRNAFISWLYNNPGISEVIKIVSPSSINTQLAYHYLGMLMKYKDAIDDEMAVKALETGKILKSYKKEGEY